MQKIIFTFIVVCVFYSQCLTVKPQKVRNLFSPSAYKDTNPGRPLLLTPLLAKSKLEEARVASQVSHADFRGVKSHSGFITVSQVFNSNLFFWFFPAEENYAEAPVVVWLQGGPGISSLFGLFIENGPFQILEPNNLTLRDFTWSKTHSMLYIDNPVGTGFSYTDIGGLATEETQVGEQLYEFLQQFFTLFPELRKNELYITGESYAGKYVPAIGYTVLKKNPTAKLKLNLQGLAIGNGLSDPVHQYNYADYLYKLGIVDENIRDRMKNTQDDMLKSINDKQWDRAQYHEFQPVDMYMKETGLGNKYNYLEEVDPTIALRNYSTQYVQRNDIRLGIHVGDLSYDPNNDVVDDALAKDMPKSVAPWVSELLSNYRVLIYNGQVDVIVAYPLVLNYLQRLNFSSAAEYKTAPRRIWRVDGHLAGYVKEAGNLTEVLVRNAGHMVPYDQPKLAYDLIYKFIRKIPLY